MIATAYALKEKPEREPIDFSYEMSAPDVLEYKDEIA